MIKLKVVKKRGLQGALTKLKKRYASCESKIGFLAGVNYPANPNYGNHPLEAESPKEVIELRRAGTLPVATVATMNEYGFVNVPMRPFFRDTIAEKQRDWLASFKKDVKSGAYLALVNLSQEAVKDIKETITTNSYAPNSERTVKYKGFNHPLIHTRFMRDHVQYKAQKK